jgi:hypothetical protein
MSEYTQEIVDHLLEMQTQVNKLLDERNLLAKLVSDGRAMGMSWSQVAIGLGTSTQAAWERWGGAEMSRAASPPVAVPTFPELEALPEAERKRAITERRKRFVNENGAGQPE